MTSPSDPWSPEAMATAQATAEQDRTAAEERDQVAWEMSVRTSASQASLTEAHAFNVTARAILTKGLADTLTLSRAVFVVAVVARIVRVVRR